MSKLIYYVAASMDGYIATQDHDVSWLEKFALGDDATPYDEFYQRVGAVIMGAQTYGWILRNAGGAWPYQNVPAFVLTRQNLPAMAGVDIAFVQDDAVAIARRAKQAAMGRDVWLIGGGKTAAFFADGGVLERVFITTIPVFLGSGIDLLPVQNQTQLVPVKQRILQSGAMESVFDFIPIPQVF